MYRFSARRRLAAGAVAVAASLALAACGSDSDSDSGSGSGSDGEKAGATHTMDTVMGEVEVPDEPERVVVLDTAELDSAVTLGVTPVGATYADAESDFLSYLPEDQLKDVEDVGVIAQPNLEAVAAAKPDLILTNKERDADRYDELSGIAPTVMTETTGYPWRENFKVHAEALGKKDEAASVIADYDKQVEEVTEAVGGAGKAGDISTSFVRFIEGADARIYGEKAYIATLFEDVGLGRPGIVKQATDYGGLSLDVSPEQVDKADADVLFYSTYGSAEKSGETATLKSPLWKTMNAVKSGRAFQVDDELWIQGIGYTAAGQILDEMQEHLTK